MTKPVILITGASGQLGSELNVFSKSEPSLTFIFLTSKELPVDDPAAVRRAFNSYKPSYCINCAAYTAVDKAETEPEKAFSVNADAVGVLAETCKQQDTKLIHISTDYVFDGASQEAYTEDAPTAPINQYGASKLEGEQLCMQKNPDAIIIRTAWLYSSFGRNFVKTMIKLMKERREITVVNDQVGAPTYAADLADCILHIIKNGSWHPGIYHYSNAGRISWYDFAITIKELTESNCVVKPVPTNQYPTPAKRPSYSLLDTHKIQKTFGCVIPGWKNGLQRCLQVLSLQG